MKFIRQLFQRYVVWLVERQGWTAIPTAAFKRHRVFLPQLLTFCNTSGFLRDGRYPGGRHAERKIRAIVREHGIIRSVQIES
jgi:hypothetical protein